MTRQTLDAQLNASQETFVPLLTALQDAMSNQQVDATLQVVVDLLRQFGSDQQLSLLAALESGGWSDLSADQLQMLTEWVGDVITASQGVLLAQANVAPEVVSDTNFETLVGEESEQIAQVQTTGQARAEQAREDAQGAEQQGGEGAANAVPGGLISGKLAGEILRALVGGDVNVVSPEVGVVRDQGGVLQIIPPVPASVEVLTTRAPDSQMGREMLTELTGGAVRAVTDSVNVEGTQAATLSTIGLENANVNAGAVGAAPVGAIGSQIVGALGGGALPSVAEAIPLAAATGGAVGTQTGIVPTTIDATTGNLSLPTPDVEPFQPAAAGTVSLTIAPVANAEPQSLVAGPSASGSGVIPQEPVAEIDTAEAAPTSVNETEPTQETNTVNERSRFTLSVAGGNTILEGTGGTTDITITITRTGGMQPETLSYAITGTGGFNADDLLNGSRDLAGQVSFAQGQTTATVTIAVNPDDVPEDDEKLSVVFTGGTMIDPEVPGGNRITLTLENDDDYVSVARGPGQAASVVEGTDEEGNITLTFVVTRGVGDRADSFPWEIAGIDADDLVEGELGGDLAFGVGELSKTVTLVLRSDAQIELDETVTLTVGDGAHSKANPNASSADIVVINDDFLQVDIVADAAAVYEGQPDSLGGTPTTIAFTATRTGTDQSSWPEEILTWRVYDPDGQIELTEGVTRDAEGYVTGPFTFDAFDPEEEGSTEQTTAFLITVLRNNVQESNWAADIEIVGSGGATEIDEENLASATTWILDDDPSILIQPDPPLALEGGVLRFTIERTTALDTAFDVAYQLVSTVSGVDYFDAALTGSVHFDIGQSVAYVDVQTIDDELYNQPRALVLNLTAVTNLENADGEIDDSRVFVEAGSATGLVSNDDALINILGLEASAPDLDTGLVTFTATIERQGDLRFQHGVTWSVQPAGENPIREGEVTLLSDTLVIFEPNEDDELSDTQTVQFTVPAGMLIDGIRTFEIQLDEVSDAAIAGRTLLGVDNYRGEVTPNGVSVSIQAELSTVAEGSAEGGSFVYKITLSEETDQPVTVNWSVLGYGSVDDSVNANGADFVGGVMPSGTVTFEPYQTEILLEDLIQANPDSALEKSEKFKVGLTVVSGPAGVVGPTALGTIVNDDATIGFAAQDLEFKAFEGVDGANGMVSAQVIREGFNRTNISVDWEVQLIEDTHIADMDDLDLSLFGGALPSGTLEINAGQAAANIEIELLGDNVLEFNEKFKIVLKEGTITGGAMLGIAEAYGVIENDDAEISVVSTTLVEPEGQGGQRYVEVEIYRETHGSALPPAEVTWLASAAGTGEDFAIASDFASNKFPSGTVRFAAGENFATILVEVKADAVLEGDESFIVTLTGTNALGHKLVDDVSQLSTLVTLTNDDDLVSIDATTLNVLDEELYQEDLEDDAGHIGKVMEFTLTRDGFIDKPTTVHWHLNLNSQMGVAIASASDFMDDSVENGGLRYEDGDEVSGTATFAAGSSETTVRVYVTPDAILEDDEQFTLVLDTTGLADNGTALTVDNTTAVAKLINDDVRINVTLTPGDRFEGEDGEVIEYVYTLTREGDLSQATELDFELLGKYLALDPNGANQKLAGALSAAEFDGATSGTLSWSSAAETVDDDAGVKTITVRVKGDALAEGDEAFELQLRNTGAQHDADLTADRPVGIVNDNDALISVAAITESVMEGKEGATQTVTFQVIRTGDLSQSVTIALSSNDGQTKTVELPAVEEETITVSYDDGRPDQTFHLRGDVQKVDVAFVVTGDDVLDLSHNALTVTIDAAGFTNADDSDGHNVSIDTDNKTATTVIENDDDLLIVSGVGDGTVDARAAVAVTEGNIDEGNIADTKEITFTVSRDATGALEAGRTLTWKVTGTDGNIVNADDFEFGQEAQNRPNNGLPSGTITFASSDPSETQTITIRVRGDLDIEPSEYFKLEFTDSNGSGNLDQGDEADRTAIVVADDIGVTLVARDAEVVEGNDPATPRYLSFDVAVLGLGTTTDFVWRATAGEGKITLSDLVEGSALEGTLTFSPTVDSAVIKLPIRQDSVVQDDLDATIQLFEADGTTPATDDNNNPLIATAKLVDDDAEVSVKYEGSFEGNGLGESAISINEGSDDPAIPNRGESNDGYTKLVFAVDRTGNLEQVSEVPWHVQLDTQGGTLTLADFENGAALPLSATANNAALGWYDDETDQIRGWLEFPAATDVGNEYLTQYVTLLINTDWVQEGAETVTLVIDEPSAGTSRATGLESASVTLLNDDSTVYFASGSVTLDPQDEGNASEGETGAVFTFTINRDGYRDHASTVTWQLGGANINADDFASVGSWTTGDNQTIGTVYQSGMPYGTVTFMSKDDIKTVTVHVKAQDFEKYLPPYWTPYSVGQSLESDETFTVTLLDGARSNTFGLTPADASVGTMIGAANEASAKIFNDDVQIQITNIRSSLAEGTEPDADGDVNPALDGVQKYIEQAITFERQGDPRQEVFFDWKLTAPANLFYYADDNGTPVFQGALLVDGEPIIENGEFVLDNFTTNYASDAGNTVTGTITWAAGDTTPKTLIFRPAGNDDPGGFVFDLITTDNSTLIDEFTSGTSDSNVLNRSIGEEKTLARFNVERDEAGVWLSNHVIEQYDPWTSQTVSIVEKAEGYYRAIPYYTDVSYDSSEGPDFEGSLGTANAGSDYTATSGSVTLTDEQRSQTITVALNNDGVFETTEGLGLSLSINGDASLADHQATVTIIDKDQLGDVNYLHAFGSGTAIEGVDEYAQFTVDLGKPLSSAATLSVDLSSGDGTAAMATSDGEAADYTRYFEYSTDNGATWNTNAPVYNFAYNAEGRANVDDALAVSYSFDNSDSDDSWDSWLDFSDLKDGVSGQRVGDTLVGADRGAGRSDVLNIVVDEDYGWVDTDGDRIFDRNEELAFSDGDDEIGIDQYAVNITFIDIPDSDLDLSNFGVDDRIYIDHQAILNNNHREWWSTDFGSDYRYGLTEAEGYWSRDVRNTSDSYQSFKKTLTTSEGSAAFQIRVSNERWTENGGQSLGQWGNLRIDIASTSEDNYGFRLAENLGVNSVTVSDTGFLFAYDDLMPLVSFVQGNEDYSGFDQVVVVDANQAWIDSNLNGVRDSGELTAFDLTRDSDPAAEVAADLHGESVAIVVKGITHTPLDLAGFGLDDRIYVDADAIRTQMEERYQFNFSNPVSGGSEQFTDEAKWFKGFTNGFNAAPYTQDAPIYGAIHTDATLYFVTRTFDGDSSWTGLADYIGEDGLITTEQFRDRVSFIGSGGVNAQSIEVWIPVRADAAIDADTLSLNIAGSGGIMTGAVGGLVDLRDAEVDPMAREAFLAWWNDNMQSWNLENSGSEEYEVASDASGWTEFADHVQAYFDSYAARLTDGVPDVQFVQVNVEWDGYGTFSWSLDGVDPAMVLAPQDGGAFSELDLVQDALVAAGTSGTSMQVALGVQAVFDTENSVHATAALEADGYQPTFEVIQDELDSDGYRTVVVRVTRPADLGEDVVRYDANLPPEITSARLAADSDALSGDLSFEAGQTEIELIWRFDARKDVFEETQQLTGTVHVIVDHHPETGTVGAYIDTDKDGVLDADEAVDSNRAFSSNGDDLIGMNTHAVTIRFNDFTNNPLDLTGFGGNDKIELNVDELSRYWRLGTFIDFDIGYEYDGYITDDSAATSFDMKYMMLNGRTGNFSLYAWRDSTDSDEYGYFSVNGDRYTADGTSNNVYINFAEFGSYSQANPLIDGRLSMASQVSFVKNDVVHVVVDADGAYIDENADGVRDETETTLAFNADGSVSDALDLDHAPVVIHFNDIMQTGVNGEAVRLDLSRFGFDDRIEIDVSAFRATEQWYIPDASVNLVYGVSTKDRTAALSSAGELYAFGVSIGTTKGSYSNFGIFCWDDGSSSSMAFAKFTTEDNFMLYEDLIWDKISFVNIDPEVPQQDLRVIVDHNPDDGVVGAYFDTNDNKVLDADEINADNLAFDANGQAVVDIAGNHVTIQLNQLPGFEIDAGTITTTTLDLSGWGADDRIELNLNALSRNGWMVPDAVTEFSMSSNSTYTQFSISGTDRFGHEGVSIYVSAAGDGENFLRFAGTYWKADASSGAEYGGSIADFSIDQTIIDGEGGFMRQVEFVREPMVHVVVDRGAAYLDSNANGTLDADEYNDANLAFDRENGDALGGLDLAHQSVTIRFNDWADQPLNLAGFTRDDRIEIDLARMGIIDSPQQNVDGYGRYDHRDDNGSGYNFSYTSTYGTRWVRTGSSRYRTSAEDDTLVEAHARRWDTKAAIAWSENLTIYKISQGQSNCLSVDGSQIATFGNFSHTTKLDNWIDLAEYAGSHFARRRPTIAKTYADTGWEYNSYLQVANGNGGMLGRVSFVTSDVPVVVVTDQGGWIDLDGDGLVDDAERTEENQAFAADGSALIDLSDNAYTIRFLDLPDVPLDLSGFDYNDRIQVDVNQMAVRAQLYGLNNTASYTGSSYFNNSGGSCISQAGETSGWAQLSAVDTDEGGNNLVRLQVSSWEKTETYHNVQLATFGDNHDAVLGNGDLHHRLSFVNSTVYVVVNASGAYIDENANGEWDANESIMAFDPFTGEAYFDLDRSDVVIEFNGAPLAPLDLQGFSYDDRILIDRTAFHAAGFAGADASNFISAGQTPDWSSYAYVKGFDSSGHGFNGSSGFAVYLPEDATQMLGVVGFDSNGRFETLLANFTNANIDIGWDALGQISFVDSGYLTGIDGLDIISIEQGGTLTTTGQTGGNSFTAEAGTETVLIRTSLTDDNIDEGVETIDITVSTEDDRFVVPEDGASVAVVDNDSPQIAFGSGYLRDDVLAQDFVVGIIDINNRNGDIPDLSFSGGVDGEYKSDSLMGNEGSTQEFTITLRLAGSWQIAMIADDYNGGRNADTYSGDANNASAHESAPAFRPMQLIGTPVDEFGEDGDPTGFQLLDVVVPVGTQQVLLRLPVDEEPDVSAQADIESATFDGMTAEVTHVAPVIVARDVTVNEDDGSATVEVVAVGGDLDGSVTVDYATEDGQWEERLFLVSRQIANAGSLTVDWHVESNASVLSSYDGNGGYYYVAGYSTHSSITTVDENDFIILDGQTAQDGNGLPQGSVTFADGEKEVYIRVMVRTDNVGEEREDFRVVLDGVPAGVTLDPNPASSPAYEDRNDAGYSTIHNDDQLFSIEGLVLNEASNSLVSGEGEQSDGYGLAIEGTPADMTVTEGYTLHQFIIHREGDARAPASVDWVMQITGADSGAVEFSQSANTTTQAAGAHGAEKADFMIYTGDSSAATYDADVALAWSTAASDGILTSDAKTVVFAAGESERIITIAVRDDGIAEDAEAFKVVLTNPKALPGNEGNPGVSELRGSADFLIGDNDAPTVSVTLGWKKGTAGTLNNALKGEDIEFYEGSSAADWITNGENDYTNDDTGNDRYLVVTFTRTSGTGFSQAFFEIETPQQNTSGVQNMLVYESAMGGSVTPESWVNYDQFWRGTVDFAPGSTTAQVVFRVADDNMVDGDQNFTVTLYDAEHLPASRYNTATDMNAGAPLGDIEGIGNASGDLPDWAATIRDPYAYTASATIVNDDIRLALVNWQPVNNHRYDSNLVDDATGGDTAGYDWEPNINEFEGNPDFASSGASDPANGNDADQVNDGTEGSDLELTFKREGVLSGAITVHWEVQLGAADGDGNAMNADHADIHDFNSEYLVDGKLQGDLVLTGDLNSIQTSIENLFVNDRVVENNEWFGLKFTVTEVATQLADLESETLAGGIDPANVMFTVSQTEEAPRSGDGDYDASTAGRNEIVADVVIRNTDITYGIEWVATDAVTFDGDTLKVVEGDSSTDYTEIEFKVTRDLGADMDAGYKNASEVYWRVVPNNGSDINASDFKAMSGKVTFSAWDSDNDGDRYLHPLDANGMQPEYEQLVTLELTEDTKVEYGEDFTIELYSPSVGYVDPTASSVNGTIVNDDTGIILNEFRVIESDDGSDTAVEVTLVRVGDLSVDSEMNWSAYNVDTQSTDFDATSQTNGGLAPMTILTGSVAVASDTNDGFGVQTQTFTLSGDSYDLLINGDNTVEEDERFRVKLNTVGTGIDQYIIGDATDQDDGDPTDDTVAALTAETYTLASNSTANQAFGTIVNDDNVFGVQGITTTLVENDGGTFTYSITRSKIVPQEQTVAWAVYADGGRNVVDAGDFEGGLPSGTVTWEAGSDEFTRQITFTVGTAGDSNAEADEVFLVKVVTEADSNVLDVTGLPDDGAENDTFDGNGAKGTIVNDDGAVFISDGKPVTQSEGNTSYQFDVVYSGPAGGAQAFTVDWELVYDGAQVDDFGAVTSGTQTFTDYGTQTVSVDIAQDTDLEEGQNFFIRLKNVVNTDSNVAAEDFKVSIVDATGGVGPLADAKLGDDDFSLAVSQAGDTGLETDGRGNITFDVVRTGDASLPVEVTWSIDFGHADTTAVLEDFRATTGTFTIPENAVNYSFDVPVAGDVQWEEDEDFKLVLSYGVIGNDGTTLDVGTTDTVGTIINDDEGFSIQYLVKQEVVDGDDTNTLISTSTGTKLVTSHHVSELLESDIGVKLGGWDLDSGSTHDAHALLNFEFTGANALTFWAVWNSSGDPETAGLIKAVQLEATQVSDGIVFKVIGEGSIDGKKISEITGMEPTPTAYGVTDVHQSTVSGYGIVGLEAAFGVSSLDINEDDGPVQYRVVRQGELTGDSSVTWALHADSATLEATANNDTDFGDNVVSTGHVSFTGMVDELGVDNPAGDVQYKGSNGQLFSVSEWMDLPLNSDTDYEADETFHLSLSEPSEGASLKDGADNSYGVVIINDDMGYAISTTDVSVVEGDGSDIDNPAAMRTLTYNIHRDSNAEQIAAPSTVNWALSLASGSAAALSAADIESVVIKNGATVVATFDGVLSGAATFPADATDLTVVVSLKGDGLDEGNAVFNMTLSATSNNDTIIDAVAAVAVEDDDSTVRVTAGQGTTKLAGAFAEGDVVSSPSTTSYYFNVNRSGSNDGDAKVTWSVVPTGDHEIDITDIDSIWVDGVEQTLITDDGSLFGSGLITFADGDATTREIEVRIKQDLTGEWDETFGVVLESAAYGTNVGNMVTQTVVNDDPVLMLSMDNTEIKEGDPEADNAFTFVITRTGDTTGTSSVEWHIESLQDELTVEDFGGLFPSGVVTFTPGQSSKTVTVLTAGDALVEGDESFRVVLTNPVGADIIGPDSVDATLLDDDVAISVGTIDSEVVEGADGTETVVRFGLEAVGPAYATRALVSWHVEGVGDHPMIGSDFVGGDLPEGETEVLISRGRGQVRFEVSINGDDVFGPNESFKIVLDDVQAFAGDTAMGAAIVEAEAVAHVLDDDLLIGFRDALESTPQSAVEGADGDDAVEMRFYVDIFGGNEGGDAPWLKDVLLSYHIEGDANEDDFEYGFSGSNEELESDENGYYIAVGVKGDSGIEASEPFRLVIDNAYDSVSEGNVEVSQTDAAVLGNIIGDDYGLKLATVSPAQDEDAAVFTFEVMRQGPLDVDMTVRLQLGATDSHEADAVSAADFLSTYDFDKFVDNGNGVLTADITLAAGEGAARFTLEMAHDFFQESDERFTLMAHVAAVDGDDVASVTAEMVDSIDCIVYNDSGDSLTPPDVADDPTLALVVDPVVA